MTRIIFTPNWVGNRLRLGSQIGVTLGRRLLAIPLALLALMVLAAPVHAYLYFGQSNTRDCPIGRANLDGTGVNQDFIIGATCDSPAVVGAHIYWLYTTGNHRNIARANIDGSAVDRRFIVLHDYATGIAADVAHIYWSDSTGIGRANVDGSAVDPAFLKLASRPGPLAVDAAHIYWSDSAGIGRANLDGTQPNPGFIAATPVGRAGGIAVDSAHIYWTNFGSPPIGSPTGTIGRANIDGSGANPQFIIGAHNPSGIGVDGSHIYWANFGSGAIGRANLDGSAANESFIPNASATGGLAVDGLTPPPGQQAGALNGAVYLSATGGKVRGYREGVTATLGTPNLGDVTFSLGKHHVNRIVQNNVWGANILPGQFALNRSRISLEVIVPLGAGGQFDFTFTGRPHHVSLGCGETENVAHGTLQGLIRIRTGDRFFKTVIVRRMSATVNDTPTPETSCPPPCVQPYYTLDASGPFRAGSPTVDMTAITYPSRRQVPSTEELAVHDSTAGTGFSLIEHTITALRHRAFFKPDSSLAAANLSTPGGVLTGGLSVHASTRALRLPPNTCGGHRYQHFNRTARITGGQITARFDSIGTYVFGRNLRDAGMGGYRRLS